MQMTLILHILMEENGNMDISDMHGTHKGFTTHKHTFTQILHINIQLNKRSRGRKIEKTKIRRGLKHQMHMLHLDECIIIQTHTHHLRNVIYDRVTKYLFLLDLIVF